MTPGKINEKVVSQRASWVLEMIDALRELPLTNREEFFQNKHNLAAAESYLRRSLEALFDIGRHILVKHFAYPAAEYKEIARGLAEKKVIGGTELELMRKMAGYRNRMVHFYHEITPEELHDVCLNHLDELKLLLETLLQWIRKNKVASNANST
jgi:uncharacterized protein YutE (UPF0331/DUF86 family)